MGCAQGAKRPKRGALSRGPAAGHVRRRRLEVSREISHSPQVLDRVLLCNPDWRRAPTYTFPTNVSRWRASTTRWSSTLSKMNRDRHRLSNSRPPYLDAKGVEDEKLWNYPRINGFRDRLNGISKFRTSAGLRRRPEQHKISQSFHRGSEAFQERGERGLYYRFPSDRRSFHYSTIEPCRHSILAYGCLRRKRFSN